MIGKNCMVTHLRSDERLINTLIHFLWRIRFYGVCYLCWLAVEKSRSFLIRTSTSQILLIGRRIQKVTPVWCAQNLKRTLLHLTCMEHLLRCNCALDYWTRLLGSVLIHFWGALKYFYLAWCFLLDNTRLSNRDFKSDCGRKLRTTATLCYQFELLINTCSKKIVDIIVPRGHWMMWVLQAERHITGSCQRFKASHNCTSVATWS